MEEVVGTRPLSPKRFCKGCPKYLVKRSLATAALGKAGNEASDTESSQVANLAVGCSSCPFIHLPGQAAFVHSHHLTLLVFFILPSALSPTPRFQILLRIFSLTMTLATLREVEYKMEKTAEH